MDGDKCIKCWENIDEEDVFYECDMCRRKNHEKCSGLTSTEERVMSLRKRKLMLICDQCRNVMEKVSIMLDGFENMKKEMEEIKKCMLKVEEKQVTNDVLEGVGQKKASGSKLYSKAVADKKEVLIIKPKEKQSANEVRKTLMENIDPVQLNVEVNLGRNVKDGVILECANKDGVNKVMHTLEQSIGDKYKIAQPKKVYPKMKIINVPKEVGSDEGLRERIIRQNHLRDDKDGFHLEVVHRSRELKPGRVNIIIEVDIKTFEVFRVEDCINISLFKCRLFEFVSIVKCYKCQGFNHFAKECTVEVNVCPKCSKNHKELECDKNSKYCCINCKRANEKFNLNLNIEHTAWDRSCSCLLKMEEMKRGKTNYL